MKRLTARTQRCSPNHATTLALGVALLCGCDPANSQAGTAVPSETTATSSADVASDPAATLHEFIVANYDKREVSIPMRDGAKLFTAIYTPKHSEGDVPMLLVRTPYGIAPYGADAYPQRLAPSELLARKGWIIVAQDVRGRFMSEGTFVNMTPHVAEKSGPSDIDESTDTYDTIEWLVHNVEGHNGKVGQWGISYPGFYAAAGMIDAHPALAAVSPQAPIADWFFDDFHHHGAFFLPHTFNFLSVFDQPRKHPYTDWPKRFKHGTVDGYRFFLDLGPLANANARYFKGELPFWNDIMEHPNYDDYWAARNLLPHFRNVAPAVLTVGGWFDAEDLYGALHTYAAIEENDSDAFNVIVMGPWGHGGWARTDGRSLGEIDFGADTSAHFQREIEASFFEHYLTGAQRPALAEANMFETGSNRWRSFDAWPPRAATPSQLFAGPGGRLTSTAPSDAQAFEMYVSDPDHPVPFSAEVSIGMNKSYMVEDQRFAARRPDVVTYQTAPLDEAVTLAGPVSAELWVSSTGTDADFVVKLIDVYPPDAVMPVAGEDPRPFGDAQIMIRSEVVRARFRDGYEQPKPLPRGRPTLVTVPLQDVLHRFAPGHRIMIQIQSTWFPLVDRNPQKYVPNIYAAKPEDFQAATHRIWRSRKFPTRVSFAVLPSGATAANATP